MKRIGLFCLLLLVIASCGDKKKPVQQAHTATTEETADTGHNFYRRYSGTIAGQPVVVHLQRIGNELSGSYYYTKQGKLIDLFNSEDTTSDDNYELNESISDNGSNYPHWLLQFSDNGIKGKWISADGTKEYPLELAEQYPAGSYRFDIKTFTASRTLIKGKEAPAAVMTRSYVVAGTGVNKDDADFILSVVKKELGCDTVGNSLEDCIGKETESYLQEYRNSIGDMDTSDLASAMNNYSSDQHIKVVYNDDGLLVLENLSAGYSGGAHGYYASGYACADVKEHRIWKLEDILTVDSNMLKPLLDVAARDYFGLKLNDKLEDRMLVEEVPVTDNIFISEKGISFVYNPYEIASFADGEVVLFISYEKLKNILTPAFINRMHLFQAGSGAA